MKKLPPLAALFAILLAGGLVYSGVHHFSGKYLTSHAANNNPVGEQCLVTHKTHQVLIQNDAMVPEHTRASLCDKLTITNRDSTLRLVAFGVHDHHVAYDGVSEQTLEQGQSLTIVLNQAGTYLFHDHLEDIARGTFTVTK